MIGDRLKKISVIYFCFSESLTTFNEPTVHLGHTLFFSLLGVRSSLDACNYQTLRYIKLSVLCTVDATDINATVSGWYQWRCDYHEWRLLNDWWMRATLDYIHWGFSLRLRNQLWCSSQRSLKCIFGRNVRISFPFVSRGISLVVSGEVLINWEEDMAQEWVYYIVNRDT